MSELKLLNILEHYMVEDMCLSTPLMPFNLRRQEALKKYSQQRLFLSADSFGWYEPAVMRWGNCLWCRLCVAVSTFLSEHAL